MPDKQDGGYSDLPKWPKDAQDIPEPYRPGSGRPSNGIVGLFVGLALGAVVSVPRLLLAPGNAENLGQATGSMIGAAVVCYLIGHMVDRRRSGWDR